MRQVGCRHMMCPTHLLRTKLTALCRACDGNAKLFFSFSRVAHVRAHHLRVPCAIVLRQSWNQCSIFPFQCAACSMQHPLVFHILLLRSAFVSYMHFIIMCALFRRCRHLRPAHPFPHRSAWRSEWICRTFMHSALLMGHFFFILVII